MMEEGRMVERNGNERQEGEGGKAGGGLIGRTDAKMRPDANPCITDATACWKKEA